MIIIIIIITDIIIITAFVFVVMSVSISVITIVVIIVVAIVFLPSLFAPSGNSSFCIPWNWEQVWFIFLFSIAYNAPFKLSNNFVSWWFYRDNYIPPSWNIKYLYYIAGSAHGQCEANPVFRLATWTGKMGLSYMPLELQKVWAIESRKAAEDTQNMENISNTHGWVYCAAKTVGFLSLPSKMN